MKITFFIPAYNCERTIKESIDSILNDNFQDGDEIIIVDDKSTDGTLGLIKTLAQTYPLTILEHSQNKGGGAARNTAVSQSTHDILFCLDSDNILEKDSVKILKEALISQQADIVAFREMRFFNTNTHHITHRWIFKEDKIVLADILSNHINPPSSGNYLFTKKSWQLAGGYPEGAGALDSWGFGMRQIATGSKMITVDGYYYHRHGHASYFKRYDRQDKKSKDSLELITPFMNLISEKDSSYILDNPQWFDTLSDRPIHTRDGVIGTPGKALYKLNFYRLKMLIGRILRK